MTLSYETPVRTARMDEVQAAVTGSTARLFICKGTPPAIDATLPAGDILATVQGANPMFLSPAVAGVLTADAFSSASVTVTGTATFFRVASVLNVNYGYMQGSVGLIGSGEDLELAVVDLVLGATVDITSWTITEGNP